MSHAAISYFPPVLKEDHLDRLALISATVELDRQFWTEVRHEVHKMLDPLEQEMRGRIGNVRAASGQTTGNAFRLFTYRTFSIPGSDVDPVVAGINFVASDSGIAVEADISGEQTGDMILVLPGKVTHGSKEELLDAARDLAQRLCQHGKQVADALSDPSRRIECA